MQDCTFRQLAYERWSDVDEQAAEAWNRRAGEQAVLNAEKNNE